MMYQQSDLAERGLIICLLESHPWWSSWLPHDCAQRVHLGGAWGIKPRSATCHPYPLNYLSSPKTQRFSKAYTFGQSDSTTSKALDLHITSLSLIFSILCSPLSTIRSETWVQSTELGTPEYCQVWPRTQNNSKRYIFILKQHGLLVQYFFHINSYLHITILSTLFCL